MRESQSLIDGVRFHPPNTDQVDAIEHAKLFKHKHTALINLDH